jgi:hypothetical protein
LLVAFFALSEDSAAAKSFKLDLNIASAFGYDFPSGASNGIYFSSGQLPQISISFDDSIVGEENFTGLVSSGHRIIYNISLDSLRSPFTELLPTPVPNISLQSLPLISGKLEYSTYFSSFAPQGRSQAVFSITQGLGDWTYGFSYAIDRPGTTYANIVEFLTYYSIGGNIERNFREYSGQTSNGSFLNGSGFDVSSSILLFQEVASVPEPSSFELTLLSMAIILSARVRQALGLIKR